MNQKVKMTNDLNEELDGYYMQLVYIQDIISVEEDMNKYPQMKSTPNFTLITKCALSDAYMIALMRLYDDSKQAKTIPNLIKKCKDNKNLFLHPEQVAEQLDSFANELNTDDFIKQAINVIHIRRDSIYAHNDKKYFGNKITNDKSYFKKYHISFIVRYTKKVLV